MEIEVRFGETSFSSPIKQRAHKLLTIVTKALKSSQHNE